MRYRTHPRTGPFREADEGIAVAFVGTYGPRRCGIATFTSDLAAAVAGDDRRVSPTVLAVTEPGGGYEGHSLLDADARCTSTIRAANRLGTKNAVRTDDARRLVHAPPREAMLVERAIRPRSFDVVTGLVR